jgi:hypothetical protein
MIRETLIRAAQWCHDGEHAIELVENPTIDIRLTHSIFLRSSLSSEIEKQPALDRTGAITQGRNWWCFDGMMMSEVSR